GLPIRSFEAKSWSLLMFSPDGKELYSATHDKKAPVYDLAKGKLAREIDVEPTSAEVLAVSADGSVLAVSMRHFLKDSGVVVCDARTGKRLSRVATMHNDAIFLALSPDGKYLATCGEASRMPDKKDEEDERERKKIARTVQIWDTAAGKEWKKIEV